MKPKNIFRFDNESNFTQDNTLSFNQILKALSPFIFLIVCIIIWTQPWFKALFDKDGILSYTSITLQFSNITTGILSPSIADIGESKPLSLALGVDLINGKTVAQEGTAILLDAF